MLTLINPAIVPNPGYFIVKHPITGHVTSSPNIRLVIPAYQDYCRLNAFPVPTNEEVIDLLCQQNREICKDTQGPTFFQKVTSAFKDGTKWIMNGLPITKGEALEYRLKTCQICEHWRGTSGGTFLQGSCAKCGCSGIKLAMATTQCPVGKWSAATEVSP